MKDAVIFYVGLTTTLLCVALVAPWFVIGAGAVVLPYGLEKLGLLPQA